MHPILQQFNQRQAHPLIQFIKYGICGGLATGVHTATFFFCAWLLFPAFSADDPMVKLFHITPALISDTLRARNAIIDNFLAFVLSNLTAYILNILWVFESGRHHWAVEIGMFYLVSGISVVIGMVLMGVLINNYGCTTTTAFVAVLFTSLMINYITRKKVIFKN